MMPNGALNHRPERQCPQLDETYEFVGQRPSRLLGPKWNPSVAIATFDLGFGLYPRYDRPVPQSLSQVLLHLIWSTKDRQPLIPAETRSKLHAYLAEVVRDTGSECPRVGGTADHVHLAVMLSRTQTIAALVNHLKSHSSRWMKERPGSKHFAWQHGYGVFSVGPTDCPALEQYIIAQEEHHRKHTFQQEYRAFLMRYGMAFDERYVWD